jgi:AAA domain (dynein-related subfamily)
MSLEKKWRRGSKQQMIKDCADAGKNRREAFLELRELTESGIEPMVFKANVNGTRIAKPLSRQLLELKYQINRVYRILEIGGQELDTKNEDEEILDNEEIGDDEIEVEEEDSPEEEIEEEEETKIVATGKVKIENACAAFLAEVRRIRNFCQSRAQSGETIDHISMRPALAASKLIPAGVPVEGLLAAMCLHWPDGAKRDADIPNFDFVKFSKGIMRHRGIEEGIYHDLFGYALILAEQRIPIMLVGQFGTGKSFLARQLSDYLGVPYGETPMTPGATRGDLLGRHTVSGFIPAEFVRLYEGGGIFNFEEIDASDPSMLIVLNNALAQDHLYNSVDGKEYAKSENFIAVSTANTFGLGATREYVARERLDAATIDRWRMGRIVVPIDEKVEETILGL